MAGDVQLDEPPADLLATARRVVPTWMRRLVADACARGGVDPSTVDAELGQVVDRAAAAALAQLAALLATDVDEQRATPLSLLRDSTWPLGEFLRDHGVVAPAPDPSAPDTVARDVYRLGPATWSDVDPELQVPGLTWGAWKAMTILTRRRDEGLR